MILCNHMKRNMFLEWLRHITVILCHLIQRVGEIIIVIFPHLQYGLRRTNPFSYLILHTFNAILFLEISWRQIMRHTRLIFQYSL